ncbi:MAG: hypothetical protein AAF532_09665 [Planctomycetota bacterium]
MPKAERYATPATLARKHDVTEKRLFFDAQAGLLGWRRTSGRIEFRVEDAAKLYAKN